MSSHQRPNQLTTASRQDGSAKGARTRVIASVAGEQNGVSRPARERWLSAGVLLITTLVDDELPVSICGVRCAEVLEVEREYREMVALGDRHHDRVGIAEAEIGELCVDRHRAPERAGGAGHHGVFTVRERREKQSGDGSVHARAQQLIDLDDDGFGYEQAPAELGDQRGREGMGTVATVGRSNERARVRNDVQDACTSSAR